MGSLRNRAQVKGNLRSTAPNPAESPSHPNPRGSSSEIAKKPRTISSEPQLGPIWEHTESGWWVVEQNGMLRTGPFQSKERGREWFYRELDIKLSI